MGEATESLDRLAAQWLDAERLAIETDNSAAFEDRARSLSAAYDAAVAAASPVQLREAWEAAIEGIDLREYAAKRPALAKALEAVG